MANKDWSEKHKAGLRSAAAGRQFTQSRVKLCGWAVHDRCLVCLNNINEKESPYEGEKRRTIRDTVEATDDQLRRAPVGDLSHRIWSGECLKELRVEKARAEDVRIANVCVRSEVILLGKGVWWCDPRCQRGRSPRSKRSTGT